MKLIVDSNFTGSLSHPDKPLGGVQLLPRAGFRPIRTATVKFRHGLVNPLP